MLFGSLLAVSLAVVTPAPSRQPTIPTIAHVHSSPYSTALHETIVPALLGLMRDDALIAVSRNDFQRMNYDEKYGGQLESFVQSTRSGARRLFVGPRRTLQRSPARDRECTAAQHRHDRRRSGGQDELSEARRPGRAGEPCFYRSATQEDRRPAAHRDRHRRPDCRQSVVRSDFQCAVRRRRFRSRCRRRTADGFKHV